MRQDEDADAVPASGGQCFHAKRVHPTVEFIALTQRLDIQLLGQHMAAIGQAHAESSRRRVGEHHDSLLSHCFPLCGVAARHAIVARCR
ncbi:hypothetical protein NM04_14680 [Massilia aurea]|uniref:Uncharacterized protein n=1 Tax=Massilia aurea TaxID=373040 RepID=A0A422QJ54_9BURK|nr:hypothetical protein NM04_14680 [Massilia aurea]